ncbi:type II toxin-antitoxin system RelE/ParE family toxin [Ralstonia pseudosolanacearum]|nr:type II toxin-antitoxin system RelE/ParE family toxin [Ralstonia pseudosolanacearum]
MRLALTPLAEQDLESIDDYIAQDNPARAVHSCVICGGNASVSC